MKKKVMIPYLITGKTGMRKAVWRRFQKREDFGATFKESTRDMNGYEAGILELEAEDGIEGHKLLKTTIGQRLIDKYEIQSN